MAAKILNLKKRCFYVLSGVSNPLGKSLAIEMCRRFKPGSLALFIDSSQDSLQAVKKEIEHLENEIEVVLGCIEDCRTTNAVMFSEMLEGALSNYNDDQSHFELAFIIHNEGSGATNDLMEPQEQEQWMSYVQENLYAVVALNQQFLKLALFDGIEKLCINVTSSLQVHPLLFSSVKCSCKNARDMYFRSMADGEGSAKNIAVMSYSPGIMETHVATMDANNNPIDVVDFDLDERLQKVPRVTPLQSTLKLINILEKMSFCSGHDVDYYDTYNL